MKSQPMLQTNVRRNHIGCARKNSIKIVKKRKFMHKKEKNPANSCRILAGALGLEPRTNGFGDRDSTN